MGETERLFFGVGIPRSIADELERNLPEGAFRALPVRMIPSCNWHLTVRFLGATTPARQRVVQEATVFAALPSAFSVRINGWGAFPRPDRARVFWAGISDPAEGFAHLNRSVEKLAVDVGYEPDRRPYSPHLTLGRLRTPANLRPLIGSLPPVDLEMVVTELTLYRSDLRGGQTHYEPRMTVKLK